MPMGVSWACRWAQSVAWGLLLHREPGETDLGVNVGEDNVNTPEYAVIVSNGRRVGFWTIIYDNFFMYCADLSLSVAWKKRFERNVMLFSAVLKLSSLARREAVCRPLPLSQVDLATGLPEHIGLQFAIQRTRRSATLWWRHIPDKVLRWRGSSVYLRSPCKPAELAHIIGIILYDTLVALKPLMEVVPVIDVLRVVAKHAGGSRRKWHICDLSLPGALPLLRDYLDAVCVNPWRSHRVVEHSRSVYSVSDASSLHGLGWASFLAPVPELCENPGLPHVSIDDWISYNGIDDACDPELRVLTKKFIFLMELKAAELSLRAALRLHFLGQPLKIFLGIDATGVTHALRRGVSTNAEANVIIRRMIAYLADSGCDAEYISLRGCDNYAHELSHCRPGTAERRTATLEALRDYLSGAARRQAVVDQYCVAQGSGGWRHSEELAEELLVAVDSSSDDD